MSARENARQVREQISSEMWEQLNRLFHAVKRTTMDELWESSPHEFLAAAKEGSHLFQGITDSTMTHGEGWQFIQVGRYMERAGAVATLLDVHFGDSLAITDFQEQLEWIGLLKSCTAFEPFCRTTRRTVKPERVADFLLLNPRVSALGGLFRGSRSIRRCGPSPRPPERRRACASNASPASCGRR